MAGNHSGSNGLTGHRLVRVRTRRYVESLRWMVATLLKCWPARVVTIVALVTAGRAMQAAAFAGVLWYFSAVERNVPITALGLTIEPRSGEWLALFIAAVAAALVLATFVIYVSARMGFYIAMAFAEHVIAAVMTLDRAFPTRPALARRGTMSRQAFEVTSGKPVLFRPVNVLMALPRHLLLVIPAIAGMIWIAGEVVLFLAVLATPAIALNYIISHRVVVTQQRRSEVQRNYRTALREAIERIGDESVPAEGREAAAAALMDGEANRAGVATFASRLLSPRQSEFVSNVLAAVAIACIGFYLGYEAISGTIPLAVVIGFFVLLRLAISGLTSIAVSLTTYARFYGIVRSAYEYLTSPLPAPERFAGQLNLHAPKQEEPAPGALAEDVRVERGVPVAIVSPAEINRYTQYFFAFALTQRSRQTTREKLNAAALRCTAALAEPDGLAAHGLSAADEKDLKSRFEAAGIDGLAPPAGIVRKAAEGTEGLGVRDIARVALTTAALSKADLLIIDARLLSPLPKDERKRWLAALSDRFIAVGYEIGRFSGCIAGEAHAIVLDTDRAVAVVAAQDAVAAAAFVAGRMKPTEDEEVGVEDVE